MKIINRKGFTLVELLVTILIIGLVIGISSFAVVTIINNSKAKSRDITLANIKSSAKSYSLEYDDSAWHSLSESDYEYYCGKTKEEQESKGCLDFDNNYKYFCVTIEELINKGLLKKDPIIKNNIPLSSYVIVKKHRVTFNVLDGDTKDLLDEGNQQLGQYNMCTGTYKNEAVTKYPDLKEASATTDSLDIDYEEGITEESNIIKYTCNYGKNTNNMDEKIDASNGKCPLPSLDDDTNYYVKICMETDRKSIICSTPHPYKTKEFISPVITKSGRRNAKIVYDDTNVTIPSHYFKSTIEATTDKNVTRCTLSNGVFNCSGVTKNIDPNTWYKVSESTVNLLYPNQNGSAIITARITDGSNNFKDANKDIDIQKDLILLQAGFVKENADSIDEDNDELEGTLMQCYAEEGKGCTPKSPSPIIKRAGYNILGWSRDKNSHTAEILPGQSFTIYEDTTFYPITYKKITAMFNKNGATSISSTTGSCNIYNGETTCNITSPSITRNGFTILGWGSTSSSHQALAKMEENIKGIPEQTYYAITKRDITAKFAENGSTSISKSEDSCEIWNTSSSCSITSPTITASSNTPIVVGWNTSSLATSSTWDAESSKTFSNNPSTYYAVTKSEAKTYTIKFRISSKEAVKEVWDTPKEESCTISSTYNGKVQNKYCTIKSPTLTANPGYIVEGWGIFGYANITNGGNIETNRNDTYYSVTSEIPQNTYTATFSIIDSKSATTSSIKSSCSAQSGKTCTVKAPTLTAQSGYKAYGWTATRGSKTSEYASDSTITLSGDKTFYSVTSRDLTVYFKGNGSQILPTANKAYSNTLTCSGDDCEATCTIYNGESDKCGITTPSFANPSGDNFGYTHYFSLEEANRYDNFQSNSTDLWQASDGTLNVSRNGSVYYAIAITNINDVRYKCYKDEGGTIGFADVYYIAECNINNCKYKSIQGIEISPTRELVRNGLRLENGISQCKASYYVSACSGLNCRVDASTSSSIVTTFSSGKYLENIVRTPTAFDNSGTNWWYYVPSSKCYISGAYLSSSKPNCDSGGSSGGSSGSSGGGSYVGYYDGPCACKTNKDCVSSNKSIITWCENGTQCAWKTSQMTNRYNMCW